MTIWTTYVFKFIDIVETVLAKKKTAPDLRAMLRPDLEGDSMREQTLVTFRGPAAQLYVGQIFNFKFN